MWREPHGPLTEAFSVGLGTVRSFEPSSLLFHHVILVLTVTWAREAEVKHGRISMLAALGAIVQDVYHFPFFDKWYNGEKVWGLHDAAIKSGALWQVLSRLYMRSDHI